MSTYTYTARNADDPREVVTFTLEDHQMLVDIGVPLEQAEKLLLGEEREGEEGEESVRARIQPYFKPMLVSLLERGTRPFSIADVDAAAKGESLYVAAWVRGAGLRVAPVIFAMKRVDNPEAAHAFVEEVQERKASAERQSVMPGPFDYWGAWFLLGFATAGILTVVLTRKGRKSESLES